MTVSWPVRAESRLRLQDVLLPTYGKPSSLYARRVLLRSSRGDNRADERSAMAAVSPRRALLFTALGPPGRARPISKCCHWRIDPAKCSCGATFGRCLPSGYLTYVREGTLFAVPMDVSKLEVPTFSPDGRWIAYGSGAFRHWDVYVLPFPRNGAEPVQVSKGGGRLPHWLPATRELLFRNDAEDQQSPNHVTIVLNFVSEVRRRLERHAPPGAAGRSVRRPCVV